MARPDASLQAKRRSAPLSHLATLNRLGGGKLSGGHTAWVLLSFANDIKSL
jgi:hypothetical protein